MLHLLFTQWQREKFATPPIGNHKTALAINKFKNRKKAKKNPSKQTEIFGFLVMPKRAGRQLAASIQSNAQILALFGYVTPIYVSPKRSKATVFLLETFLRLGVFMVAYKKRSNTKTIA